MDGISILWRPNYLFSDRTCRSSVGGYCDHQENRKSVVGCDHLRCTQKGYHCQPLG